MSTFVTNMSTISIEPKRGLFPYAIHLRHSDRVFGIAQQLLRCGFSVHGRKFNPANIKAVKVTTPDGQTVAITPKATKRAKAG